MVCVVGRIRDLILQLSKSSIYSTKPVKREDVEKMRKPLTIKMFAESAKAGKWLYD
ncbi:DUF1493 family protein [Klebsiella pneumoniae]|nr:DUF1493 family protein [Klebsiella pneumoniae]